LQQERVATVNKARAGHTLEAVGGLPEGRADEARPLPSRVASRRPTEDQWGGATPTAAWSDPEAADRARRAGHELARKMSADEVKALYSERAQLLEPVERGTASAAQIRRLRMIEWQLDVLDSIEYEGSLRRFELIADAMHQLGQDVQKLAKKVSR